MALVSSDGVSSVSCRFAQLKHKMLCNSFSSLINKREGSFKAIIPLCMWNVHANFLCRQTNFRKQFSIQSSFGVSISLMALYAGLIASHFACIMTHSFFTYKSHIRVMNCFVKGRSPFKLAIPLRKHARLRRPRMF